MPDTSTNPATLAARKRAREAFEGLWKSGFMTRGMAYGWLRRKFNLSYEEAHIGRFDEPMCLALLKAMEGAPMKKPPIPNTTKLVAENPELGLLMGRPGNIEKQEAEGQQMLCASSQLPTKLLHDLTEEHLVAMGLVLGEPTPDDPLFREATLPAGWSVKPTDHPMWSDIVDAKSRKRLQVFYKASFHDRRAHLSPLTRYTTRFFEGEGDWPERRWCAMDSMTETLLWASDGQGGTRDYLAAKAWLNTHYPRWEDPSKYWD